MYDNPRQQRRREIEVVIYKYPLELKIGSAIPVIMNERANILAVQMQNGVPTLWAKVDTTSRRIERYFIVRGTGNSYRVEVGEGLEVERYLGTVQDGPMVWHVFEQML